MESNRRYNLTYHSISIKKLSDKGDTADIKIIRDLATTKTITADLEYLAEKYSREDDLSAKRYP